MDLGKYVRKKKKERSERGGSGQDV